ncbi:MAG: PAS domain S-box protein [Terracidiphilus sp.]|jgi:PAS domain S-box-containing protein
MFDQLDSPDRSRAVRRGGPAEGERAGISHPWLIVPLFILALVAGAALARLLSAYRWQSLPVLAAAIGTLIFAYLVNRMVVHTSEEDPAHEAVDSSLRQLLDSTGPAMLALNLEGELIYSNPASERLLGYRTIELEQSWGQADLLAPGECERLVAEIQKLCHVIRPPEPTRAGRIEAYLACVRMLPPSMVPTFNAQVRHRDGNFMPVTLHVSALRDAKAEIAGMVVVALEQGSMPQHERKQAQQALDQAQNELKRAQNELKQAQNEREQAQQERELAQRDREKAQRESQERYRDLFESSSEMLATLSPEGQFLYANPAWQQYFALDRAAMLALPSFEELFSSSTRPDLIGLFHRALDGEPVERAPFRHHTSDGRVLDLEMGLSRRQKAGNPLAVRCQLRDVTEQKQRENRLALQLAVSQIVGDNPPGEQAGMRILQTLCTLQGWDLGIEWIVDAGQTLLEFGAAWGVAGQTVQDFIQRSKGLTLRKGSELPERACNEGRAVWFADLDTLPPSPRIADALHHKMVSGWAVPVRAGTRVLAILEFYSSFRLREDREAIAGVEIAAASLGQMLARTQERGRADDLRRQQEILLDAVSDGICGLDREGKVRFANPAAGRLLGAKPESLTARPLHELLHGSAPHERACSPDCSLRKVAARPASAAGEENFFRVDGRSFPAEYVLTPIHGNGSLSGWVLSFRDITQRYALDRMKDEFISTVSHELRTPLTSIRGALGLLSSGMLGEVSEKASSLLRIGLTNSDRLVRLINDILDLERIQSGREPLAFRTVQLADVVKQAIEDMQPMADAAGVKLIHDATRVEVTADPDRLLQVITNLLANAVKFSPPNSPVSVMLRPGVTGVIFSVIDNGRGIPADKLETIFGRFQQVDASDSRQKGGSGLGLAICRTIVLQHSGRIWAERNPVRGSTFRIFLPYHPTPVTEPGASPDSETGHGTVVLADANAETRLRIAGQLARHGYSVVQTSTVEQTLAAARQGAHAILVDTSLDGMNGWAILPMLRRLDTASSTPVVLLSMEDSRGLAALPGGAEGLVAKPFQEGPLLTELARVLCGAGDKARILIVEDDLDLAQVIGELFTRAGIAVETAHTLKETINACSNFQPHLLVLDIGLPDGDGFNVVDWLRQHEGLAHLPLVVYSGRELSPVERRHLTLGPTQFLTKTRVQPQQLEAMVLTMLRALRQTQEAVTVEPAVPNS